MATLLQRTAVRLVNPGRDVHLGDGGSSYQWEWVPPCP